MADFPGEPIGAEAAIGWHLRQIDYHDNNASMADEMDMIGSVRWHDARRLAHMERLAQLAQLEIQFPETSKIARQDLEIEYRQMADD
jgi:hypothetical protein